ncbi:MAG: permease-like cell division protein FtsX [Blautia sp.]|nr:permease-like cell division protein FtsX [Blautia sp.]
MRPSTIWYILKQGFINIKRNGMFSVASVMTMAVCIFLFGTFYSIVVNVNHVTKIAEAQVPVTVFFEEGTTREQIEEVSDLIRKWPEVESVTYVSPDEGWDAFSQKLFPEGSAAATLFKDENPLENSANLQITMNTIERQNALVLYLNGLDHVRSVNQARQAADTLTNFNRILYYTSVIIIVILLLIAVFLIGNTIAVGISVRKEEIGIMKYIGATDRFVRAPFLLEGIVLGAVGAAIPLAALYFLYNQTIAYIAGQFTVYSGTVEMLDVKSVFQTLGPVGLVLGVGIGLSASYLVTKKHLWV